MGALRALVGVVLVCALCRVGLAETFKNEKTGEVLNGKVVGNAHKDGQECFFVRTSEKKPRTLFLAKSEWRIVTEEAPADESAKEAPAKPSTKPASDEPELRKQIGTGAGATADEALKAALMNAVEQAVGVLIDAQTIVEHNDLIQEKIIAASNAFVEKYELVKQWQEGGLNRCRLVALVRNRQLREKLEANRIIAAKVDGKSIAAHIDTEQAAKQSAAEVVKSCFADFPSKVLTVKCTADPVPVPGSTSKLRIPIEVAVDMKAYSEIMRDISPKLAKVARATATATVKYVKEKPIADAKNRDYVVGRQTLGNLGLGELREGGPVFPPPGWLAPKEWFAAATREGRGGFEPSRSVVGLIRAVESVSNRAKQAGERWGLLVMMTDLAVSGSASFTVHGLDENALASIPRSIDTHYSCTTQAVVRIRLLGEEGKEIASDESAYTFPQYESYDLLTCPILGRCEDARSWAKERIIGRVCPGAGRFHDPLRTVERPYFQVLSWWGHAYIDAGGPDQIKQVKRVELSVTWESTRK